MRTWTFRPDVRLGVDGDLLLDGKVVATFHLDSAHLAQFIVDACNYKDGVEDRRQMLEEALADPLGAEKALAYFEAKRDAATG